MMLLAEEKIGWVAEQMGHTKKSTIEKHYYKWIRNLDDKAGEKADAMVTY